MSELIKTILAVVVGAGLGFLYARYIGCRTGG